MQSIVFKKIKGQQCATATVDGYSRIEHATEGWLIAAGELKLNKKYKRTYTLSFVLEDDQWKISNYDYIDYEEVI